MSLIVKHANQNESSNGVLSSFARTAKPTFSQLEWQAKKLESVKKDQTILIVGNYSVCQKNKLFLHVQNPLCLRNSWSSGENPSLANEIKRSGSFTTLPIPFYFVPFSHKFLSTFFSSFFSAQLKEFRFACQDMARLHFPLNGICIIGQGFTN